ncbi:surface protease GP63 [Trypanosoma theileri]|uniref:Leishmanolysin-like peptidase n=1 Tax=Trypanosoma theileri TaxID=67003 RepID=A0A1X0NXQ4_9TRYP|nr:surface protease GP63 [Trypanosoma theileri]ORC89328.1 surface protease GP63 [Trypanosoma theileri]
MEKHSMRHLLWTALFLLYCSFGCLAAVVQQLPQKGESALQAYTVSDTPTEKWEPIRIAVYTKYVEDVVKECIKQRSEGDSNTTVEFCSGDNQMTAAKMNTLFKDLLPEAIKLHRDRLNVKPLKSNLKIQEEEVRWFTSNCWGFIIPSEHSTEGIPDADFMLYVNLGTERKSSAVCSIDENKRPTSARISFVPKEIVATRHYIRLAAHDIAVGLGFTTEYMSKYLTKESAPIFMNGVPNYLMMVQSNTVKDKAKKHYNCQNIKGMILDYKGNTYSGYWERRIARDELMSPYTGEPTGMYYTNLTLAAFHAMPYYQANFSMAEPMSWGNQSTCDFITKKCTEIIQDSKSSNVFCEESDKPVLQCTSDRFGLGVCSKVDTKKDGIPTEYKFFEIVGEQSDMMKGCPIIKPFQETMCENGNETLMPGSIVDKMSRCLSVKDPQIKDVNGNDVTVQGICAKVKCEDGKVHVQYKGQKSKETWHVCENDGDTIDLQGSVFSGGTIVCPKYAEVCTGLPETEPFNISYTEVVNPKEREEDSKEETKEESNSSSNSEASGVSVNAESGTSTNTQGESVPAAPGVNGSSQESSTATQSVMQRASRSRRHIADATASQSTSNPNSTEDAIQSPSTVLNGTNLTESQIKEETLKHTNVTVMFGTDSSITVSYMAPLALLVCVVGFVMVP